MPSGRGDHSPLRQYAIRHAVITIANGLHKVFCELFPVGWSGAYLNAVFLEQLPPLAGADGLHGDHYGAGVLCGWVYERDNTILGIIKIGATDHPHFSVAYGGDVFCFHALHCFH